MSSLSISKSGFNEEVFQLDWDQKVFLSPPTKFELFTNAVVRDLSSVTAEVITLYRKIAGIGDTVVNGAVKVAKATEAFWSNIKDLDTKQITDSVKDLSLIGKVTSAMIGPIAVYEFIKAWEKILLNPEMNDKIDGFIEMILSVGKGVKSAVANAEILQLIGKIGKDSLDWIFAATILRCALSVASLVSAAKGIYETNALLKEIEELEANLGSKNYKALITSLLAKKGIEKHIPEINQKTIGKIERIFENNMTKDGLGHQIAQKNLEDVYKTLKNRVHSKITNHALSIVSDSVNLIGTGVLLFTPYTPVANGLMAAGAIVSIGKYLYNESKAYDLTEKLNRYSQAPAAKVEPDYEHDEDGIIY